MSGLGWLAFAGVWLALIAVICALFHLGRVRSRDGRDAEQISADLDDTTALFGAQASAARALRGCDNE